MALKKALYGALFVVVLPLLLAAWARAMASLIPLAAPFSPGVGLAAGAAGLALMISGTAALWFHGGGLPMNAFPPPRHVARGIYGLFAHPIYIGFSMLVAGTSVAMRSGSGFWLVSPVTMLGCAALVLGYEREDLIRRFGHLPDPLIRLPEDASTAPGISECVSFYLLVLIPWMILYEAVRTLGAPPDARIAYLPFEARLPVLQWTEIFYFSAYPLACVAPLVAASRRDLRRFSIRALMAMALVFPLYLAVPLIAPPRPFTPHGPLGALMAWERVIDHGPAEAFPSFHVIWALLTAEVFAGRMPRLKWLWRGWAVLVAASCVTTGAHALVDVAAGFVVFALLAWGARIWEALRRATERIANSWREWQWGGVRAINHGTYAGVGSFLALLIVGELAGPGHTAAVLLVAVSSLAGAAMWAQYIEGSPRLLRPYGYYGGVIGGVLGALAAPLVGTSAWLMLAAYSVAGPWVQSLGRLRCLVQGCCHGHPAPEGIGIRYHHPRSRVCRLSDWKDVPLHPTPLYSILWNGYVALAMLRLWSLHASLSLIAGLYLILTGLARFVEEAYRGEPQTPVYAHLRLYQWVAIASVAVGAVITTVPRGRRPHRSGPGNRCCPRRRLAC